MRFTKSIRWRLLIWITLSLLVMLAGLDFAAYQLQYSRRVAAVDEDLRSRVATLTAALSAPPMGMMGTRFFGGPPGQFGQPNQRDQNQPDDSGPADGPAAQGDPGKQFDDFGRPPMFFGNGRHFNRFNQSKMWLNRFDNAAKSLGFGADGEYYYQLWSGMGGDLLQKSTNCPGHISRPSVPEQDYGTYARTRNNWREMYHANDRGEILLVGISLEPELDSLRHLEGWLALGSLGFLLFSLGGAWLIIGRALRPVEKISAAARRIAEGNLAERINTAEADSELGQLAGVLNSTFTRLESAFAQQKQFTADAAHELRTPIAVLISEAQTTLARERVAGDYREAVSVCLDTAQQMRRLVDSLLELARFDAGQEKLQREPFDLNALAQEGVSFIRPLADARQLKLACEGQKLECSGDIERLRRVLINLLTNAVRYNLEGGAICVTVHREGHYGILSVADTGSGISPIDLPRIFERFYRADRSRSSGGNGLGLAICKTIIEAHGGTIEVSSELGRGSTFTVRLPLAK